MGVKKQELVGEKTKAARLKFAEIATKQLKLAEYLYSGAGRIACLRQSYEVLVGAGTGGSLCTKHVTEDATIYVQNCGGFGFRAAKFYNDGQDYRLGSFQASADWALREASEVL